MWLPIPGTIYTIVRWQTGRAKALRYIAFKVTGWGSDRTGDSPKPHRDCRGTPVPRKDRRGKALAMTRGEELTMTNRNLHSRIRNSLAIFHLALVSCIIIATPGQADLERDRLIHLIKL